MYLHVHVHVHVRGILYLVVSIQYPLFTGTCRMYIVMKVKKCKDELLFV